MSQAPLDNERFSRAGGAVAAFFAAAPFAAMGGGLALAPLGAVSGLFAAPWTRLHRAAAMGGFPLALGAAFFAWAAASTLWAPEPSWRAAAMLAGAVLTLAFLVLAAGAARETDQALVRRAAIVGLAVLMAMLAIEAAFNFPISRQLAPPDTAIIRDAGAALGADAPPVVKTRGADAAMFAPDAGRATVLALVCVWGVMAMLAPFSWPGWIGMFVLFVGAGWLSAQFHMISNAVALGCGFVVAVLALRWPRATVSITAQAIAAWMLAAPWAASNLAMLTAQAIKALFNRDVPFAWLARVETWAYAGKKVAEQPLIGWGLGASDTFDATTNLMGFTLPLIPRHPHNVPMQIWLETGAVGALIAAVALAAFGRRVGAALALDRWAAAAAAGAMTTAAVIANVSVNAWALWWWCALAAAAALIRASRKIV